MKSRYVFLIMVVALVFISGFMRIPPKVTVMVKLVDQQGNPVENALVECAYHGRMEGGGSLEKSYTDSKGSAKLKGRSFFPISLYVSKEGYYETRLKDVETYKKVNGKQKYFDPEVELVIRKIKNPIAMYARHDLELSVPVVAEPVGFDLMACDWVAPYGKGEHSDFIFEVSGYWNNMNNYESTLTVTFSNKGDGLVPFEGFFTSELRSPYNAPKTGYQPEKSWYRCRKPNPNATSPKERQSKIIVVKVDDDANYFFRVRTVLDEQGNVQEALYGKLYGDFSFGVESQTNAGLVMTYYLNPTVNDRNVEFDTDQNLFENLDSLEKVMDP